MTRKNIINKNHGFVALALTLTVSGILLALVAAESLDSAIFYDEALRKEYREMNYYYAADCLDQGILALAHDYFFTVTTPIEIPEYHCTIISMKVQGDLRILTARGNFQKADVYRTATVRLSDQSLEVVEIL